VGSSLSQHMCFKHGAVEVASIDLFLRAGHGERINQ